MKKNVLSFFFYLLLCLYSCYGQEGDGSIKLTEGQEGQLRAELLSIQKEVALLKNLSSAQTEDLIELSSRCRNLEEKLKGTLQSLEQSELSVAEYRQEIKNLRSELEVLKSLFAESSKSLQRQEAQTKVWKTVGILSIITAVIEAIIILLTGVFK